MTDRAAHLVDHVFPPVPVRQAGVPAARTLRGGVEWVLRLPPRVRYVRAWDHELGRALVAVSVRAVLGWRRRRFRAGARDRDQRDRVGDDRGVFHAPAFAFALS